MGRLSDKWEAAELTVWARVGLAMPKLYFLVNAVLYLVFALICTVRHVQTSRGLGYVQLNESGHSEYLVVYGGLQLGLALFFAYLSREPNYVGLGLIFSLLLYASIVAYRVVTLMVFRPTSPITLGTAVLELALLIWAAIAWRSLQR